MIASTWTDRTMRRAALTIWLFQLGVAGLAWWVAFLIQDFNFESSWGSSGLLAGLAFQLLTFSLPSVGLLIVRRQPRNRIGWLLLAIGMASTLSDLLHGYALYGLALDPGSLPAADVAAGIAESSWVWWIGTIGIYLILLFPDGRLPSPRWRWLSWLGGVVMVVLAVAITFGSGELTEAPIPGVVNPLVVPSLEQPLVFLRTVSVSLLPTCILASAVALVIRFRRSRGVERQQLKWLATAGAIVGACFFAVMAATLIGAAQLPGEDVFWLLVLENLSLASFALLPAAIAVAILRYRLYDIDRVINRTVVYGALTLLLALGYLGLVLGLRSLLNPLTGESDLAVAASTLAVAALFRPLRTRIQSLVDRRFYRQRFDATQAANAFTAQLRQEVDLDTVTTDLLNVVRDTLQPEHATLWLRGASQAGRQP